MAATLSASTTASAEVIAPPPPASDPRVSLTARETAESPGWSPRAMAVFDGVVAGVAATVITVPAAVGLGTALTRVSPDLLGGGLPALLVMGLGPPMAVSGLMSFVTNQYEPGAYRLWPAVVATLPLHWGAMAVGALSGVWIGNIGNFALFTLAESVLLPAGATLLMQLTRRAPTPTRTVARTHTTSPTARWFDDGSVRSQSLEARMSLSQVTCTSIPLGLQVPLMQGVFE
ncbi:MAG: hypothetical protein Q8Q09_27435 [Deltaproteobacteria bacterium]|nr:hypothetical protein [Deltaproteobacteria bacterium]